MRFMSAFRTCIYSTCHPVRFGKLPTRILLGRKFLRYILKASRQVIKIRCFDQLKYKKKGHGFALKISRAYGGNLQDCTLKILHATFLDLNARTSIGVGGKQHEDVNHCRVRIKCALCANPPVAQTPHCWQEICAETLRFVTATLTFFSGFTSALIGVFLLDPLHHSSCFLSKLLSSPYSIFPFTSTPWQLPPLFPSLSSILTRSKKKKLIRGAERKKMPCRSSCPHNLHP